uniref:G-protein coupled receptors family 1 profile domain-containing protein n=1 Tax=Pipistrellus kuhlii TaxID=59472 RepID=A0A7J7UG32_PIPKU|nr:hypothetical protein mPipKuh1_009093 [Pipistrellus kuhlii]
MAAENASLVTEFILSGLTDWPGLQLPLFFLFLGFYLVTVVGNLGMITLIGLNSHLHIPMYFFLFNLSFIDLSFSTTIIPKMLMSFVSKNIISYAGCMTQFFFFCFFVFSESFILSAMAYDRYAAICKPLLYTVTMSPRVILHISSMEGRSKAFSTCSSHIMAVSLFFGSGAFMYLKPPSVLPLGQGKVSSLFYTIVVPMLNPLIYSLRNKDVKLALKKSLDRITSFWKRKIRN